MPKSYFAFGTEPGMPALTRCSEEEHIRRSIRSFILTRAGERSAHPELGSRVVDFLFRPLVEEVRSALATAVRDALAEGEPRIEVLNVELGADDHEPGAIVAQLKYRILSSKRTERVAIRLKP